MPISSGALDWPASYYYQPEGAGKLHGDQSGSNRWAWLRQGHGSEMYDSSNGQFGRNPKQNGHFRIADDDVKSSRSSEREKNCSKNNKNKWKDKRQEKRSEREKEKARKRKRRRKLCCLIFCLAVLGLLLLALLFFFVFWFHPVSHGNGHDVKCEGRWRRNFLAYNATSNNATKPAYVCCYHVDKQVWDDVIAKGDKWPDGYVIREKDCLSVGGKCLDFFPYVECGAGNRRSLSVRLFVVSLAVQFLVRR